LGGVGGLAIGTNAKGGALALGFFEGWTWCWVAAFYAIARFILADFFSTISHCPWRDFISFSNGEKETKQRKRLSTDGS
jgi:hypothetical protein